MPYCYNVQNTDKRYLGDQVINFAGVGVVMGSFAKEEPLWKKERKENCPSELGVGNI